MTEPRNAITNHTTAGQRRTAMASALEVVDSLRPEYETPTPLLLTVEEAARLLGIGRTTAFALVKSGELESIPLGRLRRIPAECITDYINRLRTQSRVNNQAA
ncbi:helix-turn-helix domain-containing protein [Kribbella catacumbae]|uniref:helix-turn-helix domain-containing protein n=1 Tax=Kribbella catacumbae TaxID=460086 RepID=UPI0003A2C10B|nr:helix-turn-helix domain-containing protein [Kribbella catacumbae]